MGKPDKSKAEGLFVDYFDEGDIHVLPTTSTLVKAKVTNTSKGRVSRGDRFNEVLDLLKDHDYDSLTYMHWINYFMYKAHVNGVMYKRGNGKSTQNVKEMGIMKSLMSNFSVEEIRCMIDFVWDAWECPSGMYKQTMGIWILSGGWLNQIYQLSTLWKKGEYKKPSTVKDPKRLREWSEPTPTYTEEVTPTKKKKFTRL